MRKLLTIFAGTLITGSIFAGGLVTNNNHSAMFTRLQNRNASTDIDAAYFNPAGLTKLGNGFFASINNQTIGQTQKVLSNYTYLSGTPKEYVGKVSAPVFPGIYAVYNTGRLSFSAGFNPIGGGGGAKYKTGLPSFEMNIADIPPSLSSQGIPTTQYAADIYFKGSSVYFGYQANVGYKINDLISVALGLRVVSAKNTYSGYIKDIKINPTYPAFGAAYNGSMVLASQFFTDGQGYLNGVSTQLSTTATSLQPLITGGAGGVLLSNGTAVGLTATQVATLEGTITLLGGNPTGMTIAQSQAFFSGASTTYGDKAATMGEYAAQTQDIIVDAKETGTGYTPVISVNISPSDKLNIAVKYEFKTELDLTTKVTNNEGGGIFVDGQKVIADMPAMISLGVAYKPVKKLLLTASFNEYVDKGIDYDGSETLNISEIDKNFLEYGLGVEYGISEKLRVSAGWSHTTTGVNSDYQSDQSFSSNTNSIGFGFGYRVTPMIDLNLGFQRAFYAQASKTYTHMLGGAVPIPVTETYNKSTQMVAIGVDFYFGKKSE